MADKSTPGTVSKAERVQAGRAYFEAWKARKAAEKLLQDVAAGNGGTPPAQGRTIPQDDPRLSKAKALLQAAKAYESKAEHISAITSEQLCKRICSVDEVIARVRDKATKKGNSLSPAAAPDVDTKSPFARQLRSQSDQQQHTNDFITSLDAWLTQVEAGMHLALRQEQQMRADLTAAQDQQRVFQAELQAAHQREAELKKQLAAAVRAIHSFNLQNLKMKERALGLAQQVDAYTT